jgi:hypothetical protein
MAAMVALRIGAVHQRRLRFAWPPIWNIRPTENVLAIGGGGEGPALRLLHCGMFIPLASQPKPKIVINAKAGTAAEPAQPGQEQLQLL